MSFDDDFEERRRQAARIGAVVDLGSVTLTSLHLDVAEREPEWPVHVDLDMRPEFEVVEELVRFTVVYDLLARHQLNEDGEGTKAFAIEASFQLDYEVPESFSARNEDLDAFGSVSVVFSAYPYFRELVQSMTARADLPRLTLGVLRSPLDGQPASISEDEGN